MDKKEIFERIEHDYSFVEELGEQQFEVFGTFLIGSQNYNLDTENSDIDTITLVIPSMWRITTVDKHLDKTINYTNGIIKIRSISDFLCNDIQKCCCTTIEILATEYCKINEKYDEPWEYLVKKADQISHMDILQTFESNRGYMKSMRVRAEKELRVNEAVARKMYAHYFRANQWLLNFLKNNSFISLFKCDDILREELFNIKNGTTPIGAIKNKINEIEEYYNNFDKGTLASSEDFKLKMQNNLQEVCFAIYKLSYVEEYHNEKRLFYFRPTYC